MSGCAFHFCRAILWCRALREPGLGWVEVCTSPLNILLTILVLSVRPNFKKKPFGLRPFCHLSLATKFALEQVLVINNLERSERRQEQRKSSVTQLCPTFWTPCAAGQASLSLPVSQSLLRLIQPSPPLSSPSPSAFNPSQHQGLFQ